MPPPAETPRPPPAGRAGWWRDLTPAHWQVFTLASLAWLFDCLDQQMFNLSRDGAVEQLIHNPARATEYASYTNSFLLIGWAIGGLTLGSLGDRFGRARVLAWSLVMYAGGTAVSAFAWNFGALCGCLLLTGLGVGGVFGLAVALVADSVPDRTRAPALGLLQALSTVGNMLGAFIGLGVGFLAAGGLLPFHLRPWQVLFLAGAAPAFVCAIYLRRLPEPERWREARRTGAARGVKFGSYRELLRHPTWSRHAWLGLLFCSAGIIGLWGLANFNPKIVASIVNAHLEKSGVTIDAVAGARARWASVGLLLQNVGGFAGMMVMARLAQRLGRRPALGIALVVSFAATVLVFRSMRTIGEIAWMMPILGFGTLGVFSVYAIYLPELFPTSLRSTGTSFCYNFGRLVAATAPITIGRITKALGGNIEAFRTAGLWVSLVLLLGIAAIPFLPETKDADLPQD